MMGELVSISRKYTSNRLLLCYKLNVNDISAISEVRHVILDTNMVHFCSASHT